MKTHPEFSFFIYDGNIYLNNEHLNNNVTVGNIELYEFPSLSGMSRFLPKGANLTTFKNVSQQNFSQGEFGTEFSKVLPCTSSITTLYYESNNNNIRLKSLKNFQRQYTMYSPLFSSSLENENLMLVNIPSIFYGTKLKQRSIFLDFYITGTLAGRLHDINGDGRLIEVTGSNSGSVAGLVLYRQGVLTLTGSWSLGANSEDYVALGNDNPKWKYWGSTASNIDNSSFGLKFEGTQEINILTMMAHADRGEFNHSNNPTFCIFNESSSYAVTGSKQYVENDQILIKNTTTSSFGDNESFIKQTFISKIGIFDKNKRLVAVAKLSSPIRKREQDAFTFKMTLDI